MCFFSQYMSSSYTKALCKTVGKIFEKHLRRSFLLLRLQTFVDLQENWNEFLRWHSQGFFAFENHFLQWQGSVWARFFDANKLFPNLLKKNQIVNNIKRHSPIFSITVKMKVVKGQTNADRSFQFWKPWVKSNSSILITYDRKIQRKAFYRNRGCSCMTQ